MVNRVIHMLYTSEHAQYVDVNHTLGRMQDELRSQLIAISSGQYLKYAHDIEHVPTIPTRNAE